MSEIKSRFMGKLKWFNAEKGYGFITPDDSHPLVPGDLFVHVTAFVDGADPNDIGEKGRVSFALAQGRGRHSGTMQAVEVRAL